MQQVDFRLLPEGGDLIAGLLNRNKLATGKGNRWTRERVTSLRSHHKIPVYRPAENGTEPWLNLTKAAAYLGVSPKTLRLAADSGDIQAMHPLPEGPWLFSRATLDEPAARALIQRARHSTKYPAKLQSLQEDLFASTA